MKLRLQITTAPDHSATFEHAGPVIRIGRDPACELSLQGEAGDAVSRRHARIELGPQGATLSDTGSSNGTLLNDRRIDTAMPLRVGDRIQMGYTGATLTVLALDLDPAPAQGRTVAVPRPMLLGGAAVAALAIVILAVLWLRKPSPDNDRAQGPPTNPPAGSTSHEMKGPPDRGEQPQKQQLPETVKDIPSEEVKEIGTYVALDGWVSVLLQRQSQAYPWAYPWAILRPEGRVSTAQTLVSLPGYRSLLVLDSGVHLTLWGDLPEFSASPPVLESVVMLQVPAAGTDLDFTLDRGRVHLANRKKPAAPARVRVRFQREVWDLELPDQDSEACLELWGLPQREAGSGQAGPPTCLGLFTNKGHVIVTTPRQTLDLAGRSRLIWVSQGATEFPPESLPKLPAWWAEPPDRNAPKVQKAMRSLLDWRDFLSAAGAAPGKKEPPPAAAPSLLANIKEQVEEVQRTDPDNQDVGVLFLAALDELDPLIDLLKSAPSPNVRGTALRALQSWVGRTVRHRDELAHILENHYREAPERAKLIVSLLYFYPPEAVGQRQTYEELICYLDNNSLLVRILALWHLDQLGSAGRLPAEASEIKYDPAWDREQRRPAVEQWKKLLAAGKLPVPARR
jgi:pSer/pThr/pTyr-binding forkhead associated (FHA) protein